MRRAFVIVVLAACAAACTPTTTGTGGTDTAGPALVSGAVNPNPVVAGSSVTVTWRLTDASGVGLTGVILRDPSTGSSITGCLATGQRVSGNAKDGVYTASCVVPALAAGGTWTAEVQSADVDGNQSDDTTITFLVSGGAGDLTAPALVSAAVAPSPAVPGGLLTVTWHLTDDSGVALTTVTLRNHTSHVAVTGCAGTGKLASGTVTDGVFTAACTLPASLAAGTYEVAMQSADVLGNTTTDVTTTFAVS